MVRMTRLFQDFIASERAGGFVLIGSTGVSLLLANSPWGEGYRHLLHYPLAGGELSHWINDGLMAIFFLLIGLELERELYAGELSNVRSALLPIMGAIGGMLVPAAFYLFFNHGEPTSGGAGIPMATDIAFALGILSLVGSRIPAWIKIFLTALAVMDDLGAIMVIALFYSKDVQTTYLFFALGIFGALLVLNRMRVRLLWIYLVAGVVMWYCMLHSGVHATVTGVLLAFAIPFGDGSASSPSYKLQHALHRPVAFLILPVFAMANTALVLDPTAMAVFSSPLGWGIVAGLLVGKPIGIFLFSYLGFRLGVCRLPDGARWAPLWWVGFLGGVGFTMSIFIALLAFDNALWVDQSKLAILGASLMAGVIGYVGLKATVRVHGRAA
jgi:Na+:H+ antiporter, NhaA family